MIVCFTTIYNVWLYWDSNPIGVETMSKLHSVGIIPFPAVTICPFTVFASSKFNYTATYRLLFKLDHNNSRDLTDEEYVKCDQFYCFKSIKSNFKLNFNWRFNVLKLSSLICFDGVKPCACGNFSDDYLDNNIWGSIQDLAPAFSDTFVHCKLFNKKIDCGTLFVPRTTERGQCYSFNTLNHHEMFTDE